MRIIAGKFRSRLLQAPPGMATRPSSDRLRETLFNVLAPRIEGAHFLDLYAGSGAVGLEALSRGAAQVDCVERAQPALTTLRTNIASLGITAGLRIHPGTVRAFLQRSSATAWQIVFLDPPWDAAEEYEATLDWFGQSAIEPTSEPRDVDDPTPSVLHADLIVIAEHRRKQLLAESYGRLTRTRLLKQGDAALSFYGVNNAAPSHQNASPSG